MCQADNLHTHHVHPRTSRIRIHKAFHHVLTHTKREKAQRTARGPIILARRNRGTFTSTKLTSDPVSTVKNRKCLPARGHTSTVENRRVDHWERLS